MSEIYDVVVVGAGPTGDTLALLLGQAGVKTLLVDKAPEIYPLPRAAHIDHETVRIFQQVGAADDVMATCRPANRYDFLTAGRQVLMRFLMEGSPSGWPASNMIHQPSAEAALRQRMAGHEAITLRTSWELLRYEDSADGVTARFATPEGEREVSARYLVGCDGASSKVRALAGASVEDLQFDEPWLVIDTLVQDYSRLPDVNLQICDPVRPTTCVLMGAGRHRWEFMLKPDETPEIALDDGFVAALLKPWNVEGAVTLERKAVYRFHALIAHDWRFGRVFLAGDAAHQTPPFAGQGLCAGLRDAANLAWKLAAVLKGEAGDALLDTYTTERRPHVKAVIELALMMGRTVCILDPAAAAARDAHLLAERAKITEDVPGQGFGFPPMHSAAFLAGSPAAGELFIQPWSDGLKWDDVSGDGAYLIAASPAPVAGVRTFTLDDPKLAPFAADFRRWLDSKGVDAVLVRPDRYMFGTGAPADLAAAWTAALH